MQCELAGNCISAQAIASVLFPREIRVVEHVLFFVKAEWKRSEQTQRHKSVLLKICKNLMKISTQTRVSKHLKEIDVVL